METKELYRPRGLDYYSHTKNETMRISSMQYMHLHNAIRAIEDAARKAKRQLTYNRTEGYESLDGLTLPALAAKLCPQYIDLTEELSKRNLTKNYNPSIMEDTNTTTTENNSSTVTTDGSVTATKPIDMKTLEATTNDLVVNLNNLRTTALASLNVVRGLAPSSVLSDLDDVEKFLTELGKLFTSSSPEAVKAAIGYIKTAESESAPAATAIPVNEVAPAATATVAEVPSSAIPIGSFKFSASRAVNTTVINKLKKYFPEFKFVSDLAKLSIYDILTVFNGEQAYNLCYKLGAVDKLQLSNKDTVYLAETDYYPAAITKFITKSAYGRGAFERYSHIHNLRRFSLTDNREAWIDEADRLHTNIGGRARARYQNMAEYIRGAFEPANEADAKALIRIHFPACSQRTRDGVLYWWAKGAN